MKKQKQEKIARNRGYSCETQKCTLGQGLGAPRSNVPAVKGQGVY